MGKRDKKDNFSNIVKNKKLPILTLDNRWHELFTEGQKTPEIAELEQEVNNLLKKQGKLVNDIKDMKKLKSNLLKDIMENMDVSNDVLGRAKEKKLDKNKQFINELNDKIEKSMDELAELPYQIKEVNERLMAESINCFYDCLDMNKTELKEVAAWITEIREELKKKILIKQDLEAKNSKIYTYMHDIFGVELMELFDKEYNKKK
jgi:predicted  nucleic acid-binding Zn-ribbon protein